jgi:hypothetical protein
MDHEVAQISQEGEAVLGHIETMFPLWFEQNKTPPNHQQRKMMMPSRTSKESAQDKPSIPTQQYSNCPQAGEFQSSRRTSSQTDTVCMSPLQDLELIGENSSDSSGNYEVR